MTIKPTGPPHIDLLPDAIDQTEKDFLDCANVEIEKLLKTDQLDHFTERVQTIRQQCAVKINPVKIISLADDKLVQLLNEKKNHLFYENIFILLPFPRIVNLFKKIYEEKLEPLEDSYVASFASHHFPQFLQLLGTVLSDWGGNGKAKEAANFVDNLILLANLNLESFKTIFDTLKAKFPDYIVTRSNLLYNDPQLKKIDTDGNNRLSLDELRAYLESIDENDESKKTAAATLLSATICYALDQEKETATLLSIMNLYSHAPKWFVKEASPITSSQCFENKPKN